jgi:uncharacterized protein
LLNLVLDTNVVLDWLVWDDPFMMPLRQGVRRKRITLHTQPHAINELQRVLAYPQLKLTASRQQEIVAAYGANTSVPKMPDNYAPASLLLPEGFPKCRDPDDQPFLALAFHASADALVSRDKAVLKLRKRAQKFGVAILDVPQAMALISKWTNEGHR